MVQVLPGVKRVPIFPKGRQIADADCKTASTLSVAFDPKYRIIFYATQARQTQKPHRPGVVPVRRRTLYELVAALGALVNPSQFPASTSGEAFALYNHVAGRPCASGATKHVEATQRHPHLLRDGCRSAFSRQTHL